jgi:hypothetical protein
LIDYLVNLRNILEDPNKLTQDQPSRLAKLEQLSGLFIRCLAEVNDLKVKLELKDGWKGRISSLTWLLRECDIERSLERLRDLQDSVRSALDADHMYVPTLSFKFHRECLGAGALSNPNCECAWILYWC